MFCGLIKPSVIIHMSSEARTKAELDNVSLPSTAHSFVFSEGDDRSRTNLGEGKCSRVDVSKAKVFSEPFVFEGKFTLGVE